MNIANAYWARKALELRELLSKFIGFTFETHDLVQKPVHICVLFSGCINKCLLSLSTGCIRQHFGLCLCFC